MAREGTPWSATNGLLFGLAAGAVMAVAELVLAMLTGEDVLRPVRMSAAVVLGLPAFTPEVSPLLMRAVGLGLHLLLAALWGVVYSVLDALLPPDGRARWEFQAPVGMLFGIGVWLVDFQFVARGRYPWFLELPQFPQIVLHAVFLGLPLALLFTAAERRRAEVPVDEPVP